MTETKGASSAASGCGVLSMSRLYAAPGSKGLGDLDGFRIGWRNLVEIEGKCVTYEKDILVGTGDLASLESVSHFQSKSRWWSS